MVDNMTKPKWVKGEWGPDTADVIRMGEHEAGVYVCGPTWIWQVARVGLVHITSSGTGTNKTDAKRRAIEEIERLQGLTGEDE
jgi:hypothetical protein